MSHQDNIHMKRCSNQKDTSEDSQHRKGFIFDLILITTAGLVLGSTVIEILNITYILPISECELHWTMQDKGLLSVTAVLGVIFGSLFWGSLADIYGRRLVLYPTLFMTFVFTTLSSFATSFWSIFFLRLSSGFL